jgi:uncharacterized protein (TIGR01777 family)
MKIIITGGTGDIGRYLITELKQHGHELIVLSRSPQKYKGSIDSDVRLVQWDAKTADGWDSEADGADAIVNLSSENIAGDNFLPARWTDEQKRKIKQSRINAGKAVVEAVQQAQQKPKLVLQSSAVGYYGPRNDGSILDESAPPGSDFLGQVGGEWEASTAPVKEMGLRQAIVRTGLVQVAESGTLQRLLFQYKLFGGGPFGGGQQWWAWIHIRDVVKAMRFLLEKEDADGPYNLTAPNPVTNKEYSKVLGRVLKRPSFIPIPAFAMRLLVGEVATVVLDGQRAVPTRLQEAGYDFQFTNLEPALEDLLK